MNSISAQLALSQMKMEQFIDKVCQAFDAMPNVEDREKCHGAFKTLLALATYATEAQFALECDKTIPRDKSNKASEALRDGLKAINHTCQTTTEENRGKITSMLLKKVGEPSSYCSMPTF